jgi:hypothetical protein
MANIGYVKIRTMKYWGSNTHKHLIDANQRCERLVVHTVVNIISMPPNNRAMASPPTIRLDQSKSCIPTQSSKQHL